MNILITICIVVPPQLPVVAAFVVVAAVVAVDVAAAVGMYLK